MSFSKPFSGMNNEVSEDNQKFHDFRLDSPAVTPIDPNFFKENNQLSNLGGTNKAKECIDSFLDKPLTQERFNIFNAFEEGEKWFWEKENKEDGLFGFRIESLKPSFKQPLIRKNSENHFKDYETASNTKDVALYGIKKEAKENVFEVNCNTFSGNQTKAFNIEQNVFGDLIEEDNKKLPTLNSLVSLTIEEESGALTVNTHSSKMSENKLLNNFLGIADIVDLNNLLQAIKDCEANLSVKLLKLKTEKEISF